MGSQQPSLDVERRADAADTGPKTPLFQIYKRGQGIPVRVVVFVTFVLLGLSGAHWLYLLPRTTTGWFDKALVTGGSLLTLAIVAVTGILLYRTLVRGKQDRDLLRWGALTGGIILTAVIAKLVVVDKMMGNVESLHRALLEPTLPVSWGLLVSSAAFLYGLWAAFNLVVNHPQRVDFLIETETELRKMAWPTRREYVGASVVVIIIVLIVALYLWGVDLILNRLMIWLGIGF
jgi:preprotein translocase subunit SecE